MPMLMLLKLNIAADVLLNDADNEYKYSMLEHKKQKNSIKPISSL